MYLNKFSVSALIIFFSYITIIMVYSILVEFPFSFQFIYCSHDTCDISNWFGLSMTVIISAIAIGFSFWLGQRTSMNKVWVRRHHTAMYNIGNFLSVMNYNAESIELFNQGKSIIRYGEPVTEKNIAEFYNAIKGSHKQLMDFFEQWEDVLDPITKKYGRYIAYAFLDFSQKSKTDKTLTRKGFIDEEIGKIIVESLDKYVDNDFKKTYS